MSNYDKFLELDINLKTKEMATILKLHVSTIQEYKRRRLNVNKLDSKWRARPNTPRKKKQKPKLDPIVNKFNTLPLITKFNKVYIRTRFNHCVDLTENGVESTYVDEDDEVVTFKDGLEKKIKISYTVDRVASSIIEVEMNYLLFKKVIRMQQKRGPAKENYTIFTCDRNCSVEYESSWWTVRRCSFLNSGAIINKSPYEFREWARAMKTDNKLDTGVKRWIAYDMETIPNAERILTPYMISAIVFDPERDGEECRKLFEPTHAQLADVLQSAVDDNPVVVSFRDWLFTFLEKDIRAMDESGIFYKTVVFGYNNYRFDDMLLHPSVSKYLRHTQQEAKLVAPDVIDELEREPINPNRKGFIDYKQMHDGHKYRTMVYNDKMFELEKTTRNGQVTSSRIRYRPRSRWGKKNVFNYGDKSKTHTSENTPIEMTFKDIRKWVPDKSLKECCKDYDIGKDSKMDFDVLVYNSWLTANKYDTMRSMSVEEACNLFLKPKKKKGVVGGEEYAEFASKDYCKDNVIRPWDMCKDYCMRDSLAAKELAAKIYRAMKIILDQYCEKFDLKIRSKNIFNYISPAQLSYQCFVKNVAYGVAGRRLHINDARFARFIASSYYGGRTDYSFIGQYTTVSGNLRYYDVTSEYPLAMLKKYPQVVKPADMLVGEDIDLNKYQTIINTMIAQRKDGRSYCDFTIFRPFDEDFNAIFLCDVIPPDDITELITFGPMATRVPGVPLKYQNCKRTNVVVNTAYLKNYIMCGFAIVLVPSVYNCVFVNLTSIFTDFIKFFGEAKTTSKSDDNKSASRLYKLIINSLAGKLAQKPKDVMKEMRVSFDKDETVERRVEDWSKSNHYLAAFILGEANFILYSTCYRLQQSNVQNKVPHSARCGALLYMDTDSIIFDADLCDDIDFDFTENLGRWNTTTNYFDITWKAKYNKKQKADGIIVFAKKSYVVMCGNEMCDNGTKLKGIHGEQVSKFTDAIPEILAGAPKKVTWDTGIVRKAVKRNNVVDIDRLLMIDKQQKTLQCAKGNGDRIITSTNSRVNAANAQNIIYFVTSELPKCE